MELCCAGEDISALMCLSNSGYYKKKNIDILFKKKVTGDIQKKKNSFYCNNYKEGGWWFKNIQMRRFEKNKKRTKTNSLYEICYKCRNARVGKMQEAILFLL